MNQSVRPPRRLEGKLVPPGDKSLSHRAALLNALGEGRARVAGYADGEDCWATVASLRALGAAIEAEPSRDPQAAAGALDLTVQGVGLKGLEEPASVLDVGNSGTTLRLLAGVMAGQPFFSVLTGDASLRSRPMGRIVEPLRRMGAAIDGREGGSRAPLTIRGGPLQGIEHRTQQASAQVKSALLLAGLYAEGQTTVEEPALSRDHTERLLGAMGAEVGRDGRRVWVRSSRLRALDLRVPGDFSSAAFWLVAATLHPEARLRLSRVGVNPTRTGLLEVLGAMGAMINVEQEGEEGGEPVAALVVESRPLRALGVIEGDLIPRLIDEVPVLAVAAALAQGTTVIRDAAELRVKESDRVATTVMELRKMGADLEELTDGLVIHGRGRLQGAVVQSHGDHRLAMALAVAGLVAQGETVIEGAECVATSYPYFWEDLAALCGQASGSD